MIVLVACAPALDGLPPAPPIEDARAPDAPAPLNPDERVPPLPSLPAPGAEEPVQVWLAALVPAPPPAITAGVLHDRVAPQDGVRERRAGVVVLGSCEEGGTCRDQLRDVDHGRDLALPDPDAGEGAWVESAIRMDGVGPTFVSAWFGTTSFSPGAAHAVNTLACATWSRSTGARLRLSDLLGPDEARRRLGSALAARRLLTAEFLVKAEQTEMLAAVRPDTDNVLLRDAGAVFVCTEAIYAEHGSVWVWPLGTTTGVATL